MVRRLQVRRLLIWEIVLILLVAGCASASAPARAPIVSEAALAPEPKPASVGESGTSAAASASRRIAKRAEMTLIVADTPTAMRAVQQLVEELGGYVADSNAYRLSIDPAAQQMQARMTVRVPAAQLDQALARLRALAVRVDRESTSTEDVTEEYTDNQSRLRNLEATEQELLALLREVRERPNATAEDILNVHRRITEVRNEIERIKGRQQYLDTLIQLATITIDLIPDELSRPVLEPGWRPQQTLRDAFRALLRALQWLVDLVIWLIVLVLPVLVVIAIPFVVLIVIIQWLRRRRPRAQ
jgi:archaellum component FlaC